MATVEESDELRRLSNLSQEESDLLLREYGYALVWVLETMFESGHKSPRGTLVYMSEESDPGNPTQGYGFIRTLIHLCVHNDQRSRDKLESMLRAIDGDEGSDVTPSRIRMKFMENLFSH